MKVPVLLVYPLLLYVTGFYQPQEIDFILKIPARMTVAGGVRRNVS
jgi:hypothetical protein